MGLLDQLRGGLARIFKRPKLPPKPPKRPIQELFERAGYGGPLAGHRGIAARTRERAATTQPLREWYQRQRGEKPKVAFTEAEMAKWRRLTADQIEGFVYGQEPLFVNSSNVGLLQYYCDAQKLQVEFLPKKGKKASAYLYSNVTAEEALSLAMAWSKGVWVWTHLRVKGSRHGHRKPYTRIK